VTEIARLSARIDSSWLELSGLADSLGPGGLTVTGPNGWAVKDHLTHVAAWELSLIGLLEGSDRLLAMGLRAEFEGSTDAINDAIWTLHRGKTGD